MKTLVTGAAGFIGSHLCEALIAEGHQVLALDNLSCGRRENIDPLIKNKNFHFMLMDVYDIDPADLDGVDWIFHLAAKADIVPSIKNPKRYHRANVEDTLTLIEVARCANVKRFVYAASSSCYGIPDDFPTHETAQIRPMYPYALTKWVGEQYVLHWAQVYGLSALSLRLFNVYGPRHRTNKNYGAVFGVFMSQIANQKPVTIVGDGTQSRDFTFVTDVCRAFILAAKSSVTGLSINIGSGWHYPVNHIAELLGASEKTFIPKRPGEPGITFADIARAKALLGYSPVVSIEEGCKIMRDEIPNFKDAPLWTPETIEKETAEWFKHLGGK